MLLPLAAIKDLINEIIHSRSKKFLNEVPLDSLNRLLSVLDRQIKFAQGLSIDANENVKPICYCICVFINALEGMPYEKCSGV